MWRYAELLPLNGPPTVGHHAGGTPLVRATRLGRELGVDELWVKNDAVCHPTLSFKDRVVAVAVSKAAELGFDHVACASTGNLANAVAAHAAALGPQGHHLHPQDPRAGQDHRHPGVRRPGHRHRRHLRRRQPAVRRGRRPLPLGLRQRQPAAVLLGGLQERGVRDRRRAGLAGARSHRRAHGGRLAGHQDSARPGASSTSWGCSPGRWAPRASTGPRPRGAGPSSPRSRPDASSSSRSRSPRPSPARWPSATRPTATTRSRPSPRAAAVAWACLTTRSSPA